MSDFDFLFGNERSDEAKRLWGNQMNEYGAIAGDIFNMRSGLEGVNSLGALQSKFGVGGKDDVNNAYNPLIAALNSNSARARGRTASRLGLSATPETAFGGVESSSADSLAKLLSAKGQAQIGQEDFAANLLNNIINNQNSFNLNKNQLRLGAQGQLGNAENQYLQNLDPNSLFGDILGAGATVGKFLV